MSEAEMDTIWTMKIKVILIPEKSMFSGYRNFTVSWDDNKCHAFNTIECGLRHKNFVSLLKA